jgi:hypothetical protein
MMKIERSGSASGSGSISLRHGSADPDLDPHQKGMDPQHWFLHGLKLIPDQGPGVIRANTVDKLRFWMVFLLEGCVLPVPKKKSARSNFIDNFLQMTGFREIPA